MKEGERIGGFVRCMLDVCVCICVCVCPWSLIDKVGIKQQVLSISWVLVQQTKTSPLTSTALRDGTYTYKHTHTQIHALLAHSFFTLKLEKLLREHTCKQPAHNHTRIHTVSQSFINQFTPNSLPCKLGKSNYQSRMTERVGLGKTIYPKICFINQLSAFIKVHCQQHFHCEPQAHTRTQRRTLATLPLPLIYYTWAGILELNEPLNGNYILPPVTPPIWNLGSNCPNCLTPSSPLLRFLFFYLFFFYQLSFTQTHPAPAHTHMHTHSLSLCGQRK